MAVYLKSLPGGGTLQQPLSADESKMQQGQTIYYDQCAACHGGGGQGIVGLFPRLAGAPLVEQQQATSLIRVVLEGSRAIATTGAPTGPAMPSFAWKLSNDDIAAVITYIRHAWGNTAPGVQPIDVGSMRQSLHREAERAP